MAASNAWGLTELLSMIRAIRDEGPEGDFRAALDALLKCLREAGHDKYIWRNDDLFNLCLSLAGARKLQSEEGWTNYRRGLGAFCVACGCIDPKNRRNGDLALLIAPKGARTGG